MSRFANCFVNYYLKFNKNVNKTLVNKYLLNQSMLCSSQTRNNSNNNNSNEKIISNQKIISQKPTNCDQNINKTKKKLKITFIRNDGSRITVLGNVGDNLLDVVVNNDVDLDGFGACEGTLACSTCHLIFKNEDYDKISDKPTDEELDMLDLAYDLTDTSRLGCQVYLTEEFDGLEVRVPASVNDVRSN